MTPTRDGRPTERVSGFSPLAPVLRKCGAFESAAGRRSRRRNCRSPLPTWWAPRTAGGWASRPRASRAAPRAQGEKGKASAPPSARLFIRHWDTWEDGRRSHLFVMPSGGGEPKDLMPAVDADASEITFTPDGRGLIFVARDVGRE